MASSQGPRGRWMDFDDAASVLKTKNVKKMKKLGVQHMAFERGDKVSAA